MTRLDYEGMRRKQKASDGHFDDLPPVGSYADMRRYQFNDAAKRSDGLRSRTVNTSASYASLAHDTRQLMSYVTHAEHQDFRRKLYSQQKEISEIIRRLLDRYCMQWGAFADIELIGRAQKIVRHHAH